jgi:hypothetical protein
MDTKTIDRMTTMTVAVVAMEFLPTGMIAARTHLPQPHPHSSSSLRSQRDAMMAAWNARCMCRRYRRGESLMAGETVTEDVIDTTTINLHVAHTTAIAPLRRDIPIGTIDSIETTRNAQGLRIVTSLLRRQHSTTNLETTDAIAVRLAGRIGDGSQTIHRDVKVAIIVLLRLLLHSLPSHRPLQSSLPPPPPPSSPLPLSPVRLTNPGPPPAARSPLRPRRRKPPWRRPGRRRSTHGC